MAVVFVIAIAALVVGIIALTKSHEKFEVLGQASDEALTTSLFTDLLRGNKKLITDLVDVKTVLSAKTDPPVYIPSLRTDSLATNDITGTSEASPLSVGAISVSGKITCDSLTVNPEGTALTIEKDGADVPAINFVKTPSLNVIDKNGIIVAGDTLYWTGLDGHGGCYMMRNVGTC